MIVACCRQKQKNFHTTTVVVKGCEWECSRVKEATLLLMDNLCTGLAGSVPVIMLMEISPQHHSTVLGKGNINLKIIMQVCYRLFDSLSLALKAALKAALLLSCSLLGSELGLPSAPTP